MLPLLLVCPLVFGDDGARAANELERKSVLNFVLEGGSTVVIDHSGDWTTPTPVSIRNVELVDTSTDAHGGVARVAFDADAEDVDCESGLYPLEVDDSMGDDGRILAIFDGVVLLELDGVLRYLAAPDARVPRWRVTWSSRYSMTPYLASPKSRLVKPRTTRKRRR